MGLNPSTDSTQSHPGLVTIRKLNSCRFKGLLDYDECCSTRLSFSSLKLSDGHNANPCGVCELLLTPIKKCASCSTLGRCEHAAKSGN
jgi:hypothetical protein